MSQHALSTYPSSLLNCLIAVVILLCALVQPGANAQTEDAAARPQVAREIYIPIDLDDAMTQLDLLLRPEDVEQMRNGTEAEMAQYHMGLGLWLRNNWGLRAGSRLDQWFTERRVRHPDAMSGIILQSYWRRLHGRPIDLEGQVQSYLAYVAEQRELRTRERERGARAAQRIGELMMGMSLQTAQGVPVRIPRGCSCGPRARHLAKYRDGVLAVVRMGEVEAFTTAGYFLDLNRRTLHPIEVLEIQHMESSVVAGGVAYFSGMTGGKPVLMAIDGKKRISIDLPIAGVAPMLGIDGDRLLAVYARAIYRLQADRWETLYSGSIELPKSGLPPARFGQRIYFRDEGNGENGKRLWWLEHEATPRLVRFTDDTQLVGPTGPRWENAASYSVARDGSLWIALGEPGTSSSLVRRSEDGAYAIATINGRFEFDGELMGAEPAQDDLSITGVALDAAGALIAVGDRGLYAIEGRRLRELIAFDLPRNNDGADESISDLNNLLDLSGGRYVLSSAFGGMYILELNPTGEQRFIAVDKTLGEPLKF
jgi:hypothetical protein